MMPNARWAGDLLAILHLRPNRLAIIVSPWEFGPALTSYCTHRRTSNLPTDGANCRVTIFGPSPLQWICRVWPKVGLWWGDGLFWGWKAHKIRRPNIPGRKDPSLEDGNTPTPLDHAGASLLSLGLPFLWVVSVVIYSSLPFILLLHLSVIHAYPQALIPSAILSGALWAVVALIALSRSHIHIKGG